MSEAELHVLKQRMLQGRLNRARRGELAQPLPTGYVRRASGEVALDPDEQVQAMVRRIFRKFEELGTLQAVLSYLVKSELRLGFRVRCGEGKGELEWRRPNLMTLHNLLKNPIYAGAYAQVVERAVVDTRGGSERAVVAIEWAGGVHTEGELIRPVARVEQLSYYAQLRERMVALAGEGLSAQKIAQRLVAEGYRPPKGKDGFGLGSLQEIMAQAGVQWKEPRVIGCASSTDAAWTAGPKASRQRGSPA